MNPSEPQKLTKSLVQSNYLSVLERVQRAAARSDRPPDSVKIIGVTKYVNAEIARWLVEAGCLDLGESRPQSLWEKAAELGEPGIRWHLIGHLQRNKVKRTLPLISAMHSLDSPRILEQIQVEIQNSPSMLTSSQPLQLLLEINVSGDRDKTGLSIAEGEHLLDTWKHRENQNEKLAIVGLMGMGGLVGGPERARTDFQSLRQLRDQWQTQFNLPLPELSMGMSDDFEIAIEEGATMVRVGSVLFENPESKSIQ
jgi:PLP dependent protein